MKFNHTDRMVVMCGVVRDGAPCDELHYDEESTVSWFMASTNGSLYGNGKDGDDDVIDEDDEDCDNHAGTDQVRPGFDHAGGHGCRHS